MKSTGSTPHPRSFDKHLPSLTQRHNTNTFHNNKFSNMSQHRCTKAPPKTPQDMSANQRANAKISRP